MKKSTMKTQLLYALGTLAVCAGLQQAAGQGTAFTYQGKLTVAGNPANGSYDLQFSLYAASSGGSATAGPLTNAATGVTNGLFTVTLDFGPGVFTGTPYWLAIATRTNGLGAFTELTPRQPLAPTPYAIYAETAGSAGTVSGGGAGWSLTGNSGTTSADFVGTTDDQALELHTDNLRGLRLEPGSSGTVNVLGGVAGFDQPGLAGVTIAGGGYYGGGENFVYANWATIGGGYNNRINSGAAAAVIAGGTGQQVSGNYGTIPGGYNNVVSGTYGFAAGQQAQALHQGAFVWADSQNAPFASTANDQFNVRADGGVRFVTGGAGLTVDGVPVGGSGGGGGSGWGLTGNSGTVPGVNFLGTLDDVPLEFRVDGTRILYLDTAGNVVAGSDQNLGANASWGTIGGGLENTVSNLYPTVAGGEGNVASAAGSSVGGGIMNLASGPGATVGGGGYDGSLYAANVAGGPASTIAGGLGNSAFSYYSTVAGGYSNVANSVDAAVGGGAFNNASGVLAVVPGGDGNMASGNYSFAAGTFAQAAHTGAFVWADDSGGSFSSTANNQFSVRATGGVRLVTGGAGLTVDGVPVTGGGGGGGGSGTNAWSLTGNAGANPADGYFLGTTDTNGLELRVDGARGLRLDYVAELIGQFDYLGSVNVNAGDFDNTISNGAVGATIAGGGAHTGPFQGADYGNTVTASYGTVGGGYSNHAGYGATVPGGYDNSATADGSFAAGRNARAGYPGNFVWGDGSQAAVGTGTNRFDVLASGGVNFYTSGVNIYAPGGGMSVVGNKTGVNTTAPSQALEVNGEFIMVDGLGGLQSYVGDDGYGNDVQIGSLVSGITAVSCYNEADNAYMHLYCSSITIEGGSDLAEPFPMAAAEKEIPQGAVVVIDKQHPGQLKLSDQPYDRRVAGVVSGANGINPGIQMQQQGLLEGGKNVALTGRVYVQADASNGPIEPGDLLTTSATPGHAMKVTDATRAQGAILGKAMTGLAQGQGMILLLVTLQ